MEWWDQAVVSCGIWHLAVLVLSFGMVWISSNQDIWWVWV